MEQATKPSKEERINQRWDRICTRRHKDDADYAKLKKDTTVDFSKILPETKQQIRESRDEIDDNRDAGQEKVTDIAVESDLRTAHTRFEHEKLQKTRVEQLGTELEKSTDANLKIEAKWQNIAQNIVSQEIYEGIKGQKEACRKVINSKDEITKKFGEAFKGKSEAYVSLLKKQESDTTQLIWRMHKEYETMKDQYGKQLVVIQESFMSERRKILEHNKKDMENLFEKRRKLEVNMIEAQNSRHDKYQKDLDRVRLLDDEKYNKMKIDMENNIQLLEQQLEEMRAKYQLNHEKLQYNYQVLQEREKENKDTVAFQKRKFKRLKEAVASMKSKYEKSDHKYKHENTELSEEYRRITKQYKELQRKYKHFEKVDSEKYFEIWKMKEEQVMEIVEKVLQADRIVHEQILGSVWQEPDITRPARSKPGTGTRMSHSAIVSRPSAGGFGAAHSRQQSNNQLSQPSGSSFSDTGATATFQPSVSAPTTTQATGSGTPGGGGGGLPMTLFAGGRFSNEAVQRVMELLVSEAGFLVDKKIVEAVEGAEGHEQNVYKIDSILKALGVEDREDMEEIVALFYSEASETGAEQLIVHPNDFVKEIRKFVEGRQQVQNTRAGVAPKSDVTKEKRERKRIKDREFWLRLANVIPDEKFRVWAVLDRAMQRYVDILEQRSETVGEVEGLNDQNTKLKELLKGYLASDVNQQLIVPPTHILNLQHAV
eukprot:447658_1